MFRILVVEDDKNARRLREAVLKGNGYEPLLAVNGIHALQLLEKTKVDLIITDIMMPDMDGFELTEMIRSSGSTIPILIVTAKNNLEDKRKGFTLGTDDYVTKPVEEEELLFRIKALLRRAQIADEHRLVVGDVTLDYKALAVEKDGKSVTMPQKEFYLLYKLLSYPNQIFTRRQLIDEIWNMETESDERTVDVHINRLRERFKEYDEFSIVTVRGLGYKVVRNV